MKRTASIAVAAFTSLAIHSGAASAQQYPARPVTMLCWSQAGSPADVFARMVGKLLSAELGQNVVIENRVGGNGIILVNSLLRAPADGYTIGAITLTLATLFSEPAASFKPEDLQFIARSQVDPFGLFVHASTPFRTLEEFVAFARRRPGFVNVGGPFQMSAHRVTWEVFSEAAKIKTTWVPYNGGGPTTIAVAGGHVDAAATNPGAVKPMIAAGKVRVLAFSSETRLEDFPDIPTYKERGYDVVRYQWRGVMARAGTSRAVVDRLATAMQRAQQKPEWKEHLRHISLLEGYLGPEEFRAQVLRDKQEVEAVKKRLGL
jgi:putative tricarboxylic transport membrane protein